MADWLSDGCQLMLTPSDRFLNFSRWLLSLVFFCSCEQLQRQHRYLFVIHLHEAASRTDETPRVDHVEQLRGSVRIGRHSSTRAMTASWP